MSQKLQGLRQRLNSFKARQHYQGQKGQVHTIDELRGDERNGQEQYAPERQVHQKIVHRLLQSRNQRHASLYSSQCAVESGKPLLLVTSTSAGQEVLHTLHAIHDVRIQFSPQRELPLSQPACKHPGQERYHYSSSDQKREGSPGQYQAENGEQTECKQGNQQSNNQRRHSPQVNIL